MKPISGIAVHFLAILTALFSSVAAKTEAGKNLQSNIFECIANDSVLSTKRTTFARYLLYIIQCSCLFIRYSSVLRLPPKTNIMSNLLCVFFFLAVMLTVLHEQSCVFV